MGASIKEVQPFHYPIFFRGVIACMDAYLFSFVGVIQSSVKRRRALHFSSCPRAQWVTGTDNGTQWKGNTPTKMMFWRVNGLTMNWGECRPLFGKNMKQTVVLRRCDLSQQFVQVLYLAELNWSIRLVVPPHTKLRFWEVMTKQFVSANCHPRMFHFPAYFCNLVIFFLKISDRQSFRLMRTSICYTFFSLYISLCLTFVKKFLK